MEIRYPDSLTGDGSAQNPAWIEPLARAGYTARGVVFLLVGVLAVLAALGSGGDTTDTRGALASLPDSALGTVILGAIALGLGSYAVWSLVRAVKDPERDGAAKRAFFGLTAVIYASLAFETGRMALSGVRSGGSDSARHWSATLLEQPLGQWLLGAAGLAIALYGVQQLVHAWRVKLDDQLDLASLSSHARTWAVRAGRAGLAARGVVFAIIGAYVVIAAVEAQPTEARGLDGTLDLLARTPWLLLLIATGLAAYGVYNLVRARYRRIPSG
jgi:hypothetical protein